MMKRITILSLSGLILTACSAEKPSVTNTSHSPVSNNSVIVSSRNESPVNRGNFSDASPTGTKKKWSQSGNPIDTSSFDVEIKQAESKLNAAPQDESLKKSLAEAYTKRGLALTEARQYASALGDFRRALKYDAGNQEAQSWIKQIIAIYNSINTEYPKEGEEPPPLPFKKQ